MFIYWFFLLIIIHSVMKLVGAYVFFRSTKRKRDQQWEGSLEATTVELQKVKGQLQDGAMEGESTM
jgi:5-bromo-4-chloroindolyl phosphate hydrolysis protein